MAESRTVCKHCGEPLEHVHVWVHRFWMIQPNMDMVVSNPYDHAPEPLEEANGRVSA